MRTVSYRCLEPASVSCNPLSDHTCCNSRPWPTIIVVNSDQILILGILGRYCSWTPPSSSSMIVICSCDEPSTPNCDPTRKQISSEFFVEVLSMTGWLNWKKIIRIEG